LLENPEYRYITHVIEDSNVSISVIAQYWKVTIKRIDKKLFLKSVVGRNRFLRFIKQMMEDVMNKPHTSDGFSILLDAKDLVTRDRLNSLEINAESTTLLIAGKLSLGLKFIYV
jgi:hypothetical protein